MDGFTAPLDCKIGVFVRTVKNGLGNLLEALDLATINGDHPVAWTHAGLFGRSAGNKFVHYRRSDVLTVHHCEARQDHNSEQEIDCRSCRNDQRPLPQGFGWEALSALLRRQFKTTPVRLTCCIHVTCKFEIDAERECSEPPARTPFVHPGSQFLRSEEHTSELQSLMRNQYAVFCLTKKKLTYHNLLTLH